MVNDMVNHFAKVCNDSLAEHGVKNGQTIYLAGNVLVPVEPDSFDFRMKFLGTFVIDGHIVVTDDVKMFYIDPTSFVQMTADEEAELIKTRDNDFVKQDVMADEAAH